MPQTAHDLSALLLFTCAVALLSFQQLRARRGRANVCMLAAAVAAAGVAPVRVLVKMERAQRVAHGGMAQRLSRKE